MSHVNGWVSDAPTPAQLKEFFAQIQSGRITKESLQDFLRGNKRIKIWKTIKIGGFQDANAIRRALLDKGVIISTVADDMLRNIPLVAEEEEVDLVALPGSEGVFQLAEDLGLELCPAEVGPRLREQYPDQPKGEHLVIAMRPVVMTVDPYSFHIARDGDYKMWLSSNYSINGDYFGCRSYQFIFRRPRAK